MSGKHIEDYSSVQGFLYDGLRLNAQLPQDTTILVAELERLQKYFLANKIESYEKELIKEYNEYLLSPKTKDGMVGCIVVLGGLFISWIIICISNLFDSKIGYVLAIGLTLFLVYSAKEDSKKDPRETLFKAEIKYKELYQNIYNSAKNNFVPPEDIFMLGSIIQALKNQHSSTYDGAKKYVREEWQKESERIRQETNKTANNKPKYVVYDPSGAPYAGQYGKCSCGAWLGPLYQCPRCGKIWK